MNYAELYAKPGHLIRRAQQIAVSIFAEECRSFGITPVQYALLYTVKHHPGIDQISIANLVALDRSNTGDVASRLEEKGWIRRTAGDKDRRTKRLYITEDGEALLADIEPQVEAAQTRMLDPLSEEERAIFLALLGKMVDINNALSRAPRRPVSQRQPAE